MDEFELYHKRCRFCTSHHRLSINIFGQEGIKLNLQWKINSYLAIEVTHDDKLPKQVCYQCLYRIESFHTFKQTCLESEHTLQNWDWFSGESTNPDDGTQREEPVQAAENDTSRISVESVAQPTSSSLSKMAETAINTQRKQKKAIQSEAMDTVSSTLKTSPSEKQANSGGNMEIVKTGRNVVRNSAGKQDRAENSEVSRFLLNMSGIGTIAVTKFEGSKGRSKDQEGSNENEKEPNEIQPAQHIVVSDDEEESDGFSGFDFEDTSAIESGDVAQEGLEEMYVTEFVANECVQFEHVEVDQNGDVTMAEDEHTDEINVDSNDALKYMMILNSPNETRYSCLQCNKSFAQKSYVKEHMKIHTGEKPFKCTVCGRCFRNNYMLKVHYRLHTGEKNFKCEDCGALFTERGALISHSRTHTGDKPFACMFCDRRFTQNPALKRHLRIHTKEKPYTCEHCDASFADRGTWRNHMRTHTGERPYDCTLCGKTFVQRTNLQAHIKTHTDERPHPCQVCESSFRTKAHLVKHLSTIHRDVMNSVVTFMRPPGDKLPSIKN